MNDLMERTTLPIKIGFILALVTILLGFFWGTLFGGFEDNLKNVLRADAEEVVNTVYHGDTDAVDKTVSRSFEYLVRGHIHANGLGIGGVALIAVLILFAPVGKVRSITSLLLGVGVLGYSTQWMFTGLLAPGVGGISQAKEIVGWYAQLTAIISLLGLVLTLYIFTGIVCRKKAKQ